MNNNFKVTEKAKIINKMSEKTWNESMQQAAKAKRVNKTEAILQIIYSNGQITISNIMALTGWDRHNIHSTFRKAKADYFQVYYNKKDQTFYSMTA